MGCRDCAAPLTELPESHLGREGGSVPLGNPRSASGADMVSRQGRKRRIRNKSSIESRGWSGAGGKENLCFVDLCLNRAVF